MLISLRVLAQVKLILLLSGGPGGGSSGHQRWSREDFEEELCPSGWWQGDHYLCKFWNTTITFHQCIGLWLVLEEDSVPF
jgi:hypothetical protein